MAPRKRPKPSKPKKPKPRTSKKVAPKTKATRTKATKPRSRKPAFPKNVKAAKKRAWSRKPKKAARKLAQAWKPLPPVKPAPTPKKKRRPKKKPRTYAEALAKLNQLEAQALKNAFELAWLREEQWRRTVYRSVIEIKATYGKDEDESFFPSKFDVQWVRDLTGLTARQVYTLFVSPDIGLKGTGLATYAPRAMGKAA